MVEEILGYLYALPAILFALSVHEFSHGYVASKLGDPTAKTCGRLTLNPFKHIDLFGFIAMMVVHFGWAKPVPINTRYFKKPRRDIALTALAGPVSNVIVAFISTFIYCIFLRIVISNPTLITNENLFVAIDSIIVSFIFINLGLAVFNLIPIPPLDGSRILDAFLPPKALLAYHKYEQIISIVLMVVIISGVVSPYIQGAVNALANLFYRFAGEIVL